MLQRCSRLWLECQHHLHWASEPFTALADITEIYWRHIWNSHVLNTYLSLVSDQSSLNRSPLWGDTVCYTHGECPEVLRCPWDIKALKHQDAFPGEGKAVKLYGRLPEFWKIVKSACAARTCICAIAGYKCFWKWQDKRKKGISMEQAWVGVPQIKWQLNKFLVSFIQNTVKCCDILEHLTES